MHHSPSKFSHCVKLWYAFCVNSPALYPRTIPSKNPLDIYAISLGLWPAMSAAARLHTLNPSASILALSSIDAIVLGGMRNYVVGLSRSLCFCRLALAFCAAKSAVRVS